MTHKQGLDKCAITSCASNFTEEILGVSLITSHMIFKGITDLECIYMYYLIPSTSATIMLAKLLIYIISSCIYRGTPSPRSYLKQRLSIPCSSTQLFHLSVLLFNEFEKFQSGKNIFIHELLFSDMMNNFSKISRLFFFSPKGCKFSAINNSPGSIYAPVSTCYFQYI